MGLYEERLARYEAAIALEPVDKVPLISGGTASNAAFMGVKLADYLREPELNCTVNIEATQRMGNFDGVQSRTMCPYGLSLMWLSQVTVPGRELPDNELWQIREKPLIQQTDYDDILENGFEQWRQRFLKEKLGDPLSKMKKFNEYKPVAAQRFYEADIPCVKQTNLMSPFEMFCGGRSLMEFLTEDLMEIPEKVDEVFAVTHAYNMKQYTQLFESDHKPYGVWVGGWRGTPGMINREWFEHYSWKYIRELVDLCVNYQVIPILHLDSCWDLGLSYFRELPAKKCVMALDGKTDIFKAKEAVGDRMCIMGDVSAEMLAFGKPSDVYDYVTKLLNNVGPTGYIVCSGCDIPFNARLENVQMMSKAVNDFAHR